MVSLFFLSIIHGLLFLYFRLNILTVNMQNINFPDDLIRTAKLVVRMRPLGHNHCPRLNSISLNSDFY